MLKIQLYIQFFHVRFLFFNFFSMAAPKKKAAPKKAAPKKKVVAKKAPAKKKVVAKKAPAKKAAPKKAVKKVAKKK